MRWIIVLALALSACGHVETQHKPVARYELRSADGPGPLFLVGGGEDSPALLGRFLSLAGGKDAPIVIVPFAGGEVQGDIYTAAFKDRGATNLAVLKGDGSDHALVRNAAGLWFTGGAPDRLLAAFRPYADDCKAAWQGGAAVGGHSAGSMVWGSGVIVKGESTDAIAHGVGALSLQTGLAFWPNAIFDPHFGARQRFTRLWLASQDQGALGVGIDEETAAYIPNKGPLQALGVGAVTLIKPDGPAARVAVVPAGQQLDLTGWR